MRSMGFLAIMAAGALSLCGGVSTPAPAQAAGADMILTGGEIYSPDGWAEAMAIKDGVIIALGDEGDISSYESGDTQVVDLEGASIFPGLHDLHVHPMGAGLAQQQCRWPQGSPPEVVFETIEKCVAQSSKGEWIVGGQWDAASFGDTPPHRSMLDKIAPDNPVALTDISGHSAWANSRALELAGITDNTPNPPGGIIERDAKGRATGLLREAAAGLVRGKIPPTTLKDSMAALEWSLNEMLSYGITSLTDAGVNTQSMRAYASLADRGILKQRVRGCIMWRPIVFSASDDNDQDPIKNRKFHARDRFSPDCVKIVLDGVPTDGHTAAMVEPYADAEDPNDERAKGLLMVPAKKLNAALIKFDAMGMTVKMHSAGDAAVRAGLDAIAAARQANGFSGTMHDVGHNSFVQMNDIKRARGIGATFEMSPYIWYPNPIIPDIAKAVGPERMKRWIPVKDAIDAGALVVPGSDWSVVPSVNPWIAIETLVTRKAPGNKGEALGKRERISLEQAFEMYTANAALQMGHRDTVGSLEAGMLADLVVVDRNPFKIPVGEIHDTKVLMTVINGEIVYRAAAN